ncbi:MAG: 3-dehydro-L-gulonate 2-dehydrogenase [Candidatus Latescibacteria bacterium]|nr:3-dehydro-L-gulonate 2-dehydrogenase [Candidatus Latescibacterota bacterium]
MRIFFSDMYQEFYRIFKKTGFIEDKAQLCAKLFTETSLDGVQSHSVHRLNFFLDYINKGYVKIHNEPELIAEFGSFERWEGNLAPGNLNAWFSMNRAIELALTYGMGCVAIRNTNHWMRGGTYGWQAADANCCAVCFANTIPNMPPWGSIDRKVGNNPIVFAVPRKEGHIVLDMATSMFSYGQIESHAQRRESLPFHGGYDSEGNITDDAVEIMKTGLPLPMGYWKGSGLALMIDLISSALSDGNPTHNLLKPRDQHGVSQVFIAFGMDKLQCSAYADTLVNEIIDFVHTAKPLQKDGKVYYPGERTLNTRKENLEKGIPVDEEIWKKIIAM